MAATTTISFAPPGPTSIVVTLVTRVDSGAAVAATIAMQSVNVWLLTVVEPAHGLTYSYTVTGTWADGSVATVSGIVNGTPIIQTASLLSKWAVTTPPAAGQTPVDAGLVSQHLKLESGDEDLNYLQFLICAATDYAQDSLEMSLCTQTITAVFNAEDVELTPPIREYPADALNPLGSPLAFPLTTWGAWARSPCVKLPRGPVQSVTSATTANGSAAQYLLERTPAGDRLRLNGPINYPLTVVYVAGYATPAKVPPAIRAAILTHVATLYENRQSVTPNMKAMPHSMEDFYRRKTRRPIGG